LSRDPDFDECLKLVDSDDLHVLYKVIKAPTFEYSPAPCEAAAFIRICIWKEDTDLLQRFAPHVDCALVLPRVIRALCGPQIVDAVPAVHAVAMTGQLTPAYRRRGRRLTLVYLLEHGSWAQVKEVFQRFQTAYSDDTAYPWAAMLLAEAVRRVKPEAVQALLLTRAFELPATRVPYILDDESLRCYDMRRKWCSLKEIRMEHVRVLDMVLSQPGLSVSHEWCKSQCEALDNSFGFGSGSGSGSRSSFGSNSNSDSETERDPDEAPSPREMLQMRVSQCVLLCTAAVE
jgi:hypothetical protein